MIKDTNLAAADLEWLLWFERRESSGFAAIDPDFPPQTGQRWVESPVILRKRCLNTVMWASPIAYAIIVAAARPTPADAEAA
jgi:hypothetical protein